MLVVCVGAIYDKSERKCGHFSRRLELPKIVDMAVATKKVTSQNNISDISEALIAMHHPRCCWSPRSIHRKYHIHLRRRCY